MMIYPTVPAAVSRRRIAKAIMNLLVALIGGDGGGVRLLIALLDAGGRTTLLHGFQSR